MYGELEFAGVGPPKACTSIGCAESLKEDCLRSNRKLIASLKEDKLSAELLELTRADAELGRMTKPIPVMDCDLEVVRAHPRFAVDQGVKPDGSRKIRAIDNMSWCAHAGDSGHQRMLHGHGTRAVPHAGVPSRRGRHDRRW